MNAKILAALSVVANVVLLAVALRTGRGPATGAAAPAADQAVAAEIVRVKTNLTRIELTETNAAPPIRWQDVQSQDFKEFAANLLRVGCPPETVRAILERESWQKFLPLRRALLEPVHRQYWDLAASGRAFEKGSDSTRKELDKLKEETLVKVEGIVGGEVAAEKERRSRQAQWDFLSEEKERKIVALETRFEGEKAKLRSANGGKAPPDLQKQEAQLHAKLNLDVQGVMTPDERAEYDLRQSRHTGKVPSSAGFEATPDEARNLARIYQQFKMADTTPDRKAPDVEARKAQVAAAKKQREESLKQTLGEERYAQFRQGEDANFGEIYRITERYELPRELAARAAEALKARTEALARLPKVMPEQDRETRMQAVNLETRAMMLSVLGERALRTYERYHGPIVPVPERDSEQ